MASWKPQKRKLFRLFDEYSESHQNPINRRIHYVAVPLIVWSLVGLLSLVPFQWQFRPYVNWAAVLILLCSVYYLRQSILLGFGVLFFLAVFLRASVEMIRLVGAEAGLFVFLCLFVLSWGAQFWGHMIEGKRPSFLKDLQFLLIGPAWIVAKVYRWLGWPV